MRWPAAAMSLSMSVMSGGLGAETGDRDERDQGPLRAPEPRARRKFRLSREAAGLHRGAHLVHQVEAALPGISEAGPGPGLLGGDLRAAYGPALLAQVSIL